MAIGSGLIFGWFTDTLTCARTIGAPNAVRATSARHRRRNRFEGLIVRTSPWGRSESSWTATPDTYPAATQVAYIVGCVAPVRRPSPQPGRYATHNVRHLSCRRISI